MSTTTLGVAETDVVPAFLADASPGSAVSWGAILAGAAVAGGSTLILLALGSGLGFAASSPWPGVGPSLGAFTVMAGIWLIVTQWIASGLGGYIAGRLRTRWISTHTHEVFFRDTAHGFAVWAVATVVIATIAAAAVTAGGAAAAPAVAYQTDAMLRTVRPDDRPSAAETRAEVTRLIGRSLAKPGLTTDDRRYLDAIVAERTGLSEADAHVRVDAALADARQTADTARKQASATAIFTALAMVVGAFIASVAAAIGGRLRDLHP